MKLIKPFTLIVALGAIGSLFSQPNLADLEAKGVIRCNQAADPACLLVSVNEETPKTDAAETEYASTPASEKSRANPADVSVSFSYSGPMGDGRTWPLDNGSILASGDKIKVYVEFHQNTCVYLVHFDSHDQFNELMQSNGQRNCQPAGTRVILPRENKVFMLNHNLGQETIHTIVSRDEIAGFEHHYQEQISRIDQGVAAKIDSKGFDVVEDTATPGQARLVVCPGVDACREEFVIHHVAKR